MDISCMFACKCISLSLWKIVSFATSSQLKLIATTHFNCIGQIARTWFLIMCGGNESYMSNFHMVGKSDNI
jgi:hypothetical protein